MHSKNIVAIGGGGFGRSLGSLEIEKYIISLISKKDQKFVLSQQLLAIVVCINLTFIEHFLN